MTNDDFIKICKETIVNYFNTKVEITDHKKITAEDVYVVWLSKVLQNNKALLSTTVNDGMYYELTYNGDKEEIYLDAYKKWDNKKINVSNASPSDSFNKRVSNITESIENAVKLNFNIKQPTPEELAESVNKIIRDGMNTYMR